MKRLLVIEDGDEYASFVRALLVDEVLIEIARTGADALALAGSAEIFLVDLRFDRVPPEALLGDREETARELFGGDRARSLRHLQDQQGLYILRALRQAGHAQRAIFVHDFSPGRLAQLRALYGEVRAIGGFDLVALRAAMEGP